MLSVPHSVLTFRQQGETGLRGDDWLAAFASALLNQSKMLPTLQNALKSGLGVRAVSCLQVAIL